MTKFSGRGASIDFNGSPAGQLRSLGEFGSTRSLIDASVYGEAWTDFVTGLQDGTELDLVFAFDDADSSQVAITTAYNTAADTPVTFTVTHSVAGWSFDITALLTRVGYEDPLDGLSMLHVTAKIVNPGVVAGS